MQDTGSPPEGQSAALEYIEELIGQGAGPPTERMTDLLSLTYDDPDLFNSAFLARNEYWWRQREIAQSIVDYRMTVVYSGNAVGKDYLLGGIIPWWLWTRYEGLVIVTGPSQTLLGSVTWKEVRKAIERSGVPLKCRISNGVKASPQTVQINALGWGALGYSTTSVERASGQHAGPLLVLGEEASGIPDEIYDALDSLKFVKACFIGNPVRPDGRFIKLIEQAARDRRDGIPRHLAVNAIHIPSTDSPDADKETSLYGLADKTWIDANIRNYGADSLWVKSHIHAIIPTTSADVLIPEPYLDFAASRDRPQLPAYHPLHKSRRLAADLSEGVGRDSTAILVRDDLGILDVVVGSDIDLAGAAYHMARLGKLWDIPPGRMSYDKCGIGRDLYPHLVANGIGQAFGYVGEASPQDKFAFKNLRTEAAWKLKNRLDPEFLPDVTNPNATRSPFCIPHGAWWPRMRDELKALSYSLDKGKTVALITKEDWCIKLGHSPDLADALIQSFAA